MIKAGIVFALFMVAKIGAGLIMLKALASLLSVEQFGQVGQAMAFITVLTSFAGGGQNRSLTVNLSALHSDRAGHRRHMRTAISYFLLTTALVGTVILIFGDHIMHLIVPSNQFISLSVPVFAAVVFSGVNNLQTSIVVAAGHYRDMTINQAISLIWASIFLVAMTYEFGQNGALAAFCAFGFWLALGNTLTVLRHELLSFDDLIPLFDWTILKRIAVESLAFVIFISAMPLSQTWGRHAIGTTAGWELVGLMQAMNRLSDAMQQLYGYFFNNYVVVVFSRGKPKINDVLKLVGFVSISSLAMLFCVYVLRYFVIRAVYTQDYLVVADFMHWQLAGDFFRIFAFLGTAIIVARGFTGLFTALELLASAVYLALIWYISDSFSLASITWAYFVGSAFTGIVVAAVVYRVMGRSEGDGNAVVEPITP